jgi:hypothetical protein
MTGERNNKDALYLNYIKRLAGPHTSFRLTPQIDVPAASQAPRRK